MVPTSRTCACRWNWWMWPISWPAATSRCSPDPRQIPNGRVAALRAPGGGAFSRSEIDAYTAFVARYGAKGLAYIKVNERAKGREGLQSPILKFLDDAAVAGILERTGAQDNDLIFFGADTAKVVNDALGRAAPEDRPRPEARASRTGGRCGSWTSRCSSTTRTPSAGWPCIIRSPRRRWTIRRRCSADPGKAVAKAYDMVLNGSEIGGGSVRIHRAEMQSVVFGLLGIDAGRSAAQVRLPARCAEVRRAAAWRHRLRPRPPGHADGRRRQHPRRDRLPEDADRGLSADRCAHAGQRGAAARTVDPCPPAAAQD